MNSETRTYKDFAYSGADRGCQEPATYDQAPVSPGAFKRHNREFHEALVESGSIPILMRIWHSLLMVVNTLGVGDYAEDGGLARAAAEHESIADAVNAGDGERAASGVEAHFHAFMDSLRRRRPGG